MRPICMGPELALPAMYATTLAREAASNREDTNDNIVHCDPAGGVSSAGPLAEGTAPAVAFVSEVDFTTGITPEEVA